MTDRLPAIKRRKVRDGWITQNQADWLIQEVEETRRKMLAYARKAGRLEQELMDCQIKEDERARKLGLEPIRPDDTIEDWLNRSKTAVHRDFKVIKP